MNSAASFICGFDYVFIQYQYDHDFISNESTLWEKTELT
jgi:hypothetical protein